MKKTVRLILLCIALVIGLSIPSVAAEAASGKPGFKLPKDYNYFAAPDYYHVSEIFLVNVSKWDSIKNVKTSKNLIFYQGMEQNKGLYFHAIKPGKAWISCTIIKGGKSYKLKKNFTVYSGAPLVSVSVGDKEVITDSIKAGRSNVTVVSGTWKNKAKVTITPAKGWKIKKITYKHNLAKYNKVKPKTIKNNGKIDFKAERWTTLSVYMKDKKGHVCLTNFVFNLR